MATLLEFSMVPLGRGESVSEHVARSLEIVDESGVAYKLHAMGTVMEGEWDDLFAIVRKCYERMSIDCDRIECTIKVDWRRGYTDRLEGKVASVEKKVGRKLAT